MLVKHRVCKQMIFSLVTCSSTTSSFVLMKEHTVAVEKGSEAGGWTYSLYVGGMDREEDADDETLYYCTSDSRHLQFQHFASQRVLRPM
jgi:hypothetical protein